jgi:hypothetical protein
MVRASARSRGDQRQHVQLAVQVRVQRGLDGHQLHGRELAVLGASQPRAAVGMPQIAVVLDIVVGRLGGRGQRVPVVCLLQPRLVLSGFWPIDTFAFALFRLEEGVAAQGVAHQGGKVQRGHLQQAHRMLQAGGQALSLPMIGTHFQGRHGFLLLLCSPRRIGAAGAVNATAVPRRACAHIRIQHREWIAGATPVSRRKTPAQTGRCRRCARARPFGAVRIYRSQSAKVAAKRAKCHSTPRPTSGSLHD